MAIYALNRYFDGQGLDSTRSRKIIVMIAATLFSIGASWAVDKVDGDAELHKNDPSIADVVKSGDPVQMAKMLAGFN
ncbi:MAG: hypothetical protein V4493_10080 [Pseudomonadota bacterium]